MVLWKERPAILGDSADGHDVCVCLSVLYLLGNE